MSWTLNLLILLVFLAWVIVSIPFWFIMFLAEKLEKGWQKVKAYFEPSEGW